jgi:hypothetical protein
MERDIDFNKLYEATGTSRGPRLDGGDRRKANKAIERAGMDGNGRFSSVSQALGKIWNTLSDFDLEPDEVVSPIIRGDEGRFTQRVAWSNEGDPFSPTEIRNSMLAVFWTRLAKNSFEIVAYLS